VLDATLGAAGTYGPEIDEGDEAAGRPSCYRVGDYELLGVRYRDSAFMDVDLRIRQMDERGIALPDSQIPQLAAVPELPGGIGATVELLKVLLKMKCESAGVAQKLVATTSELELIAADDEADVPSLKGWRRELFGRAAIDLKQGRLALGLAGRRLKIIDTAGPAAQE